MQEILTQTNHYANNISQLPWGDIGVWIAASGILSTLLIPVYKWVRAKFNHYKQIMPVFVGIASTLAVAGNYLLTTPTSDPNILAIQALALSFSTSSVWTLVLKPFIGFMATQVAKARLEAESKKLAAVPTKPETQDFAL